MGKRSVILGLVVSLGMVLAASAARAQATATLVITCVDAAGQPLKDVNLTLMSLQVQKVLEAKSDKEGKAVFKKLDQGAYRVIGRRKGYEPTYREPITVVPERETAVTLQFQAGEPNIQEHAAIRATLERRQARPAALDGLDDEALVLQDGRERLADVLLVIHDQDRVRHSAVPQLLRPQGRAAR